MQTAVDILYDRTVVVDDLVAKALKLTEIARIARTETTLRRYINSKWNARLRKATEKATSMARALKPASQIAKAIDKEMGKWAGDVEKRFLESVEKMYRNARIAGWKKATKQTKASLSYTVPSFTEEVKKQRAVAEALPSFDLVDEEAIEALQDHQLFWIGKHYEENVSGSIATTTKETMVEVGKDRRVAGKLMSARVRDTLKHVRTPGGWHGSSKQYFEGLVANSATVARTHGQTKSFQAAGVTRYELINPMDRRTSEQCSHLNGKVFTVENATEMMEAELDAETPDEVKKVHPWLGIKKLKEISPRAGKVSLEDSRKLAEAGVSLPPFHFRCRTTVDISVEAGSWEPL